MFLISDKGSLICDQILDDSDHAPPPRPLGARRRADLGGSVEGVGVENGLDHDERLGQVLPVEVVSVVGALVRTVVEHLQERRAPQVEHELWTGTTVRRAG